MSIKHFVMISLEKTRSDQYFEREKSGTHLKRLGKKLENTELFRHLYSESAVQLPGSPLQNRYINWFDHKYDYQNDKQRKLSSVYTPSKHFEFRNFKEKLPDFKLKTHPCTTSHPAEKVECSMSIISPNSEVTESPLSVCCEISQVQDITQLWLERVEHQRGKHDMKLRLSPNALSLVIIDCILPKSLTCELLAQLSVCKQITDVYIENMFLDDLAHFIPKAVSSWDFPLLERLYLSNCSIREDSCCEILKSLITCQHIKRLNLLGNHIGASGKHLADAINNWGDAPLLEVLYLDNCSIREDSCCEILKSLITCQHITHLGLAGNHIGGSGKHLADAINNWGDAPLLETLNLNNCSIREDSCCEILKSLATCQHITFLSLDGNHIGASGKHLADAINNWGDAPSLEVLYLYNCSIPEDSCCEILKSLITCQHITHLSLSGNHIGASGKHLAEAINNWGDTPLLEVLYLYNCSIPEDSCCEILKSLITCQHITHLSLSGNHIGASGKHLAEAINNWGDAPLLEALGLNNCSIPEDSCCEILKSLVTCQHITHLSLQGNHIGASGKHLADAINNWGDAPLLEQLYLNNCSIPEESCCEILKSLITCQHIKHLNLTGNLIGASGKHLADAINNWGDAPLLETLNLNNCSIREDSCCEILKSLATCQHITHLGLDGNHIGASGKHLAEAINNWGDVLSLEELYLENCTVPEDGWCEILKSLRTLIKHQRLQKLSELVLSANNLHPMEDEVGELLNTCLTEIQQSLELFLNENKFSEQFVKYWTEICAGTHLTPVFDDDDDDSWITSDDDDDDDDDDDGVNEAAVKTNETQPESSEHDTDYLMIESIKINNSSISFQKPHGLMYTPSNRDVQTLRSTLFKCSSLRMLSSDDVSLGNDVRHVIKAIHVWGTEPLLQELSLTNANIPEDLCGPLLKALSSCHQLVHLNLAGNCLGIHGFHLSETVKTWGNNPKLETLNLTDCSMPSSVCGALLFALGRCKSLSDLWLPGNTLTGCMHHFLSDSSQILPSLEELFLSYTKLNKTDLVHLVQLIQNQRMPQLGELDLGGNNIHRMEESIVHLVQALVTHHPRRLKLNIWFNNLSAPLHERLVSICVNTDIELDFGPAALTFD